MENNTQKKIPTLSQQLRDAEIALSRFERRIRSTPSGYEDCTASEAHLRLTNRVQLLRDNIDYGRNIRNDG